MTIESEVMTERGRLLQALELLNELDALAVPALRCTFGVEFLQRVLKVRLYDLEHEGEE